MLSVILIAMILVVMGGGFGYVYSFLPLLRWGSKKHRYEAYYEPDRREDVRRELS